MNKGGKISIPWWDYFRVEKRDEMRRGCKPYYAIVMKKTGEEYGYGYERKEAIEKAKSECLYLYRRDAKNLSEKQCRTLKPVVEVEVIGVTIESCVVVNGYTKKAILYHNDRFFAEVSWESIVEHLKDRSKPIRLGTDQCVGY